MTVEVRAPSPGSRNVSVSATVDMTTAVTVPGAIVIVLVRFAVTKTVVVEIPRALSAVSM